MDIYNDLEQYMIENLNNNNEENKRILGVLSTNSSISIKVLIEICSNMNVDYLNYICNNPNLTIDDIEKHYPFRHRNTCSCINTLAQYYDIFHDDRIIYNDNLFYYNQYKLISIYVIYNKHLTYELFKSYGDGAIYGFTNNDYIQLNTNGNMSNYIKDEESLVNCINSFNGEYDSEMEKIIDLHRLDLGNKLYGALQYLSYDFIRKNMDLFLYLDDHTEILFQNESLTIDDILHIIETYGEKCDFELMFIYSNITLTDIVNNGFENNEYFYHFAENRNCTVSDIINNPNLNWNKESIIIMSITMQLAYNRHDYNNYENQYQFKFAD